jgi:hypothetical protein
MTRQIFPYLRARFSRCAMPQRDLISSVRLHFIPEHSPDVAYARCEPLGYLVLLTMLQPKAKRPGSFSNPAAVN